MHVNEEFLFHQISRVNLDAAEKFRDLVTQGKVAAGAKDLNEAFPWGATYEGGLYWSDIAEKIKKFNPDPPDVRGFMHALQCLCASFEATLDASKGQLVVKGKLYEIGRVNAEGWVKTDKNSKQEDKTEILARLNRIEQLQRQMLMPKLYSGGTLG